MHKFTIITKKLQYKFEAPNTLLSREEPSAAIVTSESEERYDFNIQNLGELANLEQ